MQRLTFTNQVASALHAAIERIAPNRIFLLSDVNTLYIAQELAPANAEIITIGAGDDNKTLTSLSAVWQAMSLKGATRRSLLINVGGGMITDLGGFAASCFKRGIKFINVTTTLLGAVDAAVGGKTGINFMGFKNEIGVFNEADEVIISTRYFSTLSQTELRSGFAEMLKHGLISSSENFAKLMEFDVATAPLDALLPLLQESVEVKRRVVEQDPHEQGLRKALNLGHTAGHAFESLALERHNPTPHGFAVAHGLLVELILSHMQLGFPSELLHRYATLLREVYGVSNPIDCKDYDRLLEFMTHDKKNVAAGTINFTLLRAPGQVEIDRTASPDEIRTALDIYRDLTGQ